MATNSWTLLDASHNIYRESFALSGDQLKQAPGAKVELETLHGGRRDGVRLLKVDNGALRFAVLPDRGLSIWKAWHRDTEIGDTEIGWQSPVPGPVHPRWVPLTEPGGLGWLDGFDELLVRCGLHSNGAPDFDAEGRLTYPLHGRIGNLPASHLEVVSDDQSGQITVQGTVEEVRFHFQKLRLTSTVTTMPESKSLRIHDEVTNFSGNPGEAQLLYHINLGPPVHGPGAELVAAVQELAPRDDHAASGINAWREYGPPEMHAAEQVYFFQLHADEDGRTRVLLRNADGQQGVSLQFNTKQLPYFIQWKNTPPMEDGYVTGLEPATNFPNPRTYEENQGRVLKLAPGETAEFDLEIEFHADPASVTAAVTEIQLLQHQPPTVHEQPLHGWSG